MTLKPETVSFKDAFTLIWPILVAILTAVCFYQNTRIGALETATHGHNLLMQDVKVWREYDKPNLELQRNQIETQRARTERIEADLRVLATQFGEFVSLMRELKELVSNQGVELIRQRETLNRLEDRKEPIPSIKPILPKYK